MHGQSRVRVGASVAVVLVFLLAIFFRGPEAGSTQLSGGPPYALPKFLRPAKVSAVTSPAQLLPAASRCLTEVGKVAAGDRVLFITDPTVPTVVTQAFEQASHHLGLRVEYRRLVPPTSSLEMRSLLEQAYWSTLWDQSVWNAVARAPLTLAFSYFNPEQALPGDLEQFLGRSGSRMVRVIAVPELLASDWAEVPRSLLEEIVEQTVQSIPGSGRGTLSDRGGSALNFSYELMRVEGERSLETFPLHRSIPLRLKQVSGRLNSHSGPTGFFPPLELFIQRDRIQEVRGGGSLGELLLGRLSDPLGGSFPLEMELALSTNPQAFLYKGHYAFSPYLWGQQAGAMRSGVTTLSFRLPGPEPEAGARRMALQLYFPDLSLEGTPLVKDGHLATLDLVPVRMMAASLGILTLLQEVCEMGDLPFFPDPKAPQVEPVESPEQLSPILQQAVEELRLGKEDRVLLVSDESVSPLVNRAVEQELARRKIALKRLNLKAPALADPGQSWLGLKAMYTPDAWQQMRQSTIIVFTSFVAEGLLSPDGTTLTEWLEANKIRGLALFAVPELLRSAWSRFPVEAVALLRNEFTKSLQQGNQLEVTTGDGTRLEVPVSAAVSGAWGEGKPLWFFPKNEYVEFRLGRHKVTGDLVSRYSTVGALSGPLRLKIQDGKIASVSGEGKLGEIFRQGDFALDSVRFYFSPKPFRFRPKDGGFSASLWGFASGSRRSGVAHFRFRSGSQAALGVVELQTYFPDVVVLGEGGFKNMMVEKGHLLFMNYPEVKASAAPYGDPDQLLTEEWVPKIDEP